MLSKHTISMTMKQSNAQKSCKETDILQSKYFIIIIIIITKSCEFFDNNKHFLHPHAITKISIEMFVF